MSWLSVLVGSIQDGQRRPSYARQGRWPQCRSGQFKPGNRSAVLRCGALLVGGFSAINGDNQPTRSSVMKTTS